MDRRTFEGLSALVVIVERGSFARAAKHLGVTPSALSQTIRQLEERVGTRLLHRTTRSLAPTSAGQTLLGRLRPLLNDLDAVVAETTSQSDVPTGKLRITTSRIAAELIVAPRLGAFTAAHPHVTVELVVEDHLVDIVAGRYDAGIRLGEHLAKDMVAMEVGGRQRLVVVGTPAYFAAHGRPRHPKDLLAHRCVVNLMPSGAHYRWELERDGTELELGVTGPFITNDPTTAMMAVLSSVGLGFAFEAQAAPHLASGHLEAVLPSWSPAFPGFYIYYPSRKQQPPALRAFVAAMKARVPSRG